VLVSGQMAVSQSTNAISRPPSVVAVTAKSVSEAFSRLTNDVDKVWFLSALDLVTSYDEATVSFVRAVVDGKEEIEVRVVALCVLGSAGDARAMETLLGFVTDKKAPQRLREEAISGVSRFARKAIIEEKLLSVVLDSAEPADLRRRAIRGLAALPGAAASLRSLGTIDAQKCPELAEELTAASNRLVTAMNRQDSNWRLRQQMETVKAASSNLDATIRQREASGNMTDAEQEELIKLKKHAAALESQASGEIPEVLALKQFIKGLEEKPKRTSAEDDRLRTAKKQLEAYYAKRGKVSP
jgi:hypothetical protein